MDTPIKPRTVKPRVHRRPVLVWNRRRIDRTDGHIDERIYLKRYVCYDDNVAAVGDTIEGAYKNWVSLKLDYLHKINKLATQIRGTVTSEYDIAQIGSDMDYRCG